MAPRSREQNEEIRAERIQAITRAAIKVYGDKGYLATQMDDIAQAAGIAKGLLYYYFKTKQDLFQVLFRQMIQWAVESSQQMTQSNLSLRNTLSRYIHFYVESVYTNPAATMAYYRFTDDLSQVFPNGEESSSQFYAGFIQPLVEAFARAMDAGLIRRGDAQLAASVFWNGLGGGLVILIRQATPLPDKQVVIDQLTGQLLDGLFI